MMSMPILATKPYIPTARPKVVFRPRLVEQLNEGLHRKLTLISPSLSCKDQRELLRQMIERVIVDSAGNVRLELRTPFSYLQDVSEQVRSCRKWQFPRNHNDQQKCWSGQT